MRAESPRHTLFGMLLLPATGMRDARYIINLPNSPKGVRECLAAIMPVLPRVVDITSIRQTGCGPANGLS